MDRISPPLNTTSSVTSPAGVNQNQITNPSDSFVNSFFYPRNGEFKIDTICHNVCQISVRKIFITGQADYEARQAAEGKNLEEYAYASSIFLNKGSSFIPRGISISISFGTNPQEGSSIAKEGMNSQPHVMPGQGHVNGHQGHEPSTQQSSSQEAKKNHAAPGGYYVFSESELHDIAQKVKFVLNYIGSNEFWITAVAKGGIESSIHYTLAATDNHLKSLQKQLGDSTTAEQSVILGDLEVQFYELSELSKLILGKKANLDLPQAVKRFFQESVALNTQIRTLVYNQQKELSAHTLRSAAEKAGKDGAKFVEKDSAMPQKIQPEELPTITSKNEKIPLVLLELLNRDYPGIKIAISQKGTEIFLSRADVAAVKLIASIKPQTIPLTIHMPWPPTNSKYNSSITPAESIDKMHDPQKQPFGMDEQALSCDIEVTQAFALIPAGPMLYGDPFGEEGELEIPARIEETPDFFIFSTGPVTNEQFCSWLQDLLDDDKISFENGQIVDKQYGNILTVTKEANPLSRLELTIARGKLKFIVEVGYEKHPATMLSSYAASGWCADHGLALPTEAEYEMAAACFPKNALNFDYKSSKLRYSCGNEIDETMANYDPGFFTRLNSALEGTVPNMFYNGKNLVPKRFGKNLVTVDAPSPCKVYDLVGNVGKITSTTYTKKIQGQDESPDENLIIVKGGSYKSSARDCRAAARRLVHPNELQPDVGFTPILPLFY